MSKALFSWYSLHDLMALAERRAVLEGTIGLERLGRLLDLLSSSEGSVHARLTFRMGHDDKLLMELQCDAALELVCQRCLEPLVHRVDEQVVFAVAETEDSVAQLPEGVELLSLEGDRFQPAHFIEDELIVSLPMVARHGDENHRGEN